MEAIGYGFLLGIGILLAVLLFAFVVFLLVMAGLFISYLAGKRGRKPTIRPGGARE